MAPAQNSPNGMMRAEDEPDEAVSNRDSRANDQPRSNSNPNGTPANMGGQQDITAPMHFASNSGTSFYTPYTNLNNPGGEPAHESRGGPHHAQGHFSPQESHYGHGDAEHVGAVSRYWCPWPGCTNTTGFCRYSTLQRHYISLHLLPARFICPNCGRRFNRLDNFIAHARNRYRMH